MLATRGPGFFHLQCTMCKSRRTEILRQMTKISTQLLCFCYRCVLWLSIPVCHKQIDYIVDVATHHVIVGFIVISL